MSIDKNLENIHNRITEALKRSGRSRNDPPTLVAVVKYREIEDIKKVIEAGQTLLAFNRIQEAQEKIPQLPREARWHMIGHIQRNKAKNIPRLFHMAQSVDSLRLARALDKAQRSALEENVALSSINDGDERFDILLEINVSGEQAKHGLSPEEAPEVAREISRMDHLRVRGLMTMAPFFDDPEQTRPVFRGLRELRERLRDLDLPNATFEHLSMGMTNDFEVAIEEGATIIRIGTAVFGKPIY